MPEPIPAAIVYIVFERRHGMYRRILLASALAGTLALGLAVAPAASARDSWSVSIGAPGVAISAGSPAYYGYGSLFGRIS